MKWEKSQENGIGSKKGIINKMNCCLEEVFFSSQFTILHPIFFGIW